MLSLPIHIPGPSIPALPSWKDCIDKGKKEFGRLGLLVAGYIVSAKYVCIIPGISAWGGFRPITRVILGRSQAVPREHY